MVSASPKSSIFIVTPSLGGLPTKAKDPLLAMRQTSPRRTPTRYFMVSGEPGGRVGGNSGGDGLGGRKSMGTADLLFIDRLVFREARMRKKNLAMGWIDYRNAYDMMPHSWILECLKSLGISDNIQLFLEKTMNTWRVELTCANQQLGKVNIKRGIFQGDALSPLLFVVAMIPLTHVLRKIKSGCEFTKSKEKINHLLYLDDLKLYAKNEKKLDSLV